MKTFRCTSCQQPIYFENVRCENCGAALGFVPDERMMLSFDVQENGPWPVLGRHDGFAYRPCRNYQVENVCNWMIRPDDPEELCDSCRLTEIIPALHKPENKAHWYRLEQAKRRLIYSLQGLRLPVVSRVDDPQRGLAFQFLEDTTPQERVLTGHSNGVITLNVSEADDPLREQMRKAMHEPYRTLLGHFRHEVGHYYWDILIADTPWLQEFRRLFGDEREDYANALQRHYQQGAPANWDQAFISAYASMHPWEDWAETWAHYLHMTDGLHTAENWGVSLRPRKLEQAPVHTVEVRERAQDFDTLFFDQWLPLTRFLNSLNRSLGHPDAYPFTIPSPVVEKLRFIDRVIRER